VTWSIILAENVFHPRLNEDGTMKPKEDAASADGLEPQKVEHKTFEPEAPPAKLKAEKTEAVAPTQPAPAEGEVPRPPQEAAAPPPNPNLVTIDVTRGQDIIRLAKENHEFDRRIREYAGRTAKREYEAQLNELRAENEELKRQALKANVRAMDPAEIDRKFREDKDFAKLYAEVIHDDDAPVRSDSSVESEFVYYQNVRDDLLDEALAFGMDEARAKQFRDAFDYCPVHRTDEHGFYDHDGNGIYFEDRFKDPAIARRAAFDWFRKTLETDLTNLTEARAVQRAQARPPQADAWQPPATDSAAPSSPAPTPQPAQQIGAPNPALARSPDMSASRAGGSGAKQKYTIDDLQNMSWQARIELVESLGGRQKMIEDGILYVPGLSEKLQPA
jgi:hypothetical protein